MTKEFTQKVSSEEMLAYLKERDPKGVELYLQWLETFEQELKGYQAEIEKILENRQ